MNENRRDNKKKQNSKSLLVWAVIAFVISIMGSIGDGAVALLFVIIIIAVVAGVIIAAAKRNGKAASDAASARSAGTRTAAARREFKPASFDMGEFLRKSENSLSKRLTEKMRDNLSDCDDDHEHVEPDFRADPNEKRATQLKEFLRNGLIEKEEYNILMRKYGLK